MKLSESDSDVVVKEFTRKSPPDHSAQSPVKMSKRSNIPIRIPPIESDLQALIKSVDDAQRGNGMESTGGRDGPTMNNGVDKRLTMDSGDEKDVVIKLYNPDVIPVPLSRSSSFGSIAAIQSVSINF